MVVAQTRAQVAFHVKESAALRLEQGPLQLGIHGVDSGFVPFQALTKDQVFLGLLQVAGSACRSSQQELGCNVVGPGLRAKPQARQSCRIVTFSEVPLGRGENHFGLQVAGPCVPPAAADYQNQQR